MTFGRPRLTLGISLLVLFSLDSASLHARQQPGGTSHVIIPALANATRSSDLDFQGGECDIDRTGNTMACRFQQVFLTIAAFDAQTCLVTTNRYERTFQKEGSGRWVSRDAPAGECGVTEVSTLQQEGDGARWTLEMRKTVTRKDASPRCRDVDETPELLSWRDVHRSLPCKFVQPGAMSR